MAGHRFASACAALALLLGAGAAAAQEDYGFMPEGGKALLLEIVGGNLDTLRGIAGQTRSEAEWHEAILPMAEGVDERAVRTLAGYLALNMPVEPARLAEAERTGDLAAALPPDGRELAWYGCQSCHSLFAGYLTQDRDLQGWRSMFLSPFHRELRMTEKERETFNSYSAINMPMKVEDVPEELRF
ncbi:hypothetical protein ACUN0C_14335 [Faunimonas sp. B44]|uniref:hypothetical protein n=1 Tax=Faunimonas sp. B44 TaxID=3461493 RepID=UPI004044658E